MSRHLNKPTLVAIAAALTLTGGTVAVVTAISASATGVSATCTPNPAVTVGPVDQSLSVTCSVPLPPPVTVTVEVTPPPTTAPTTAPTTVPTTPPTTVPTTAPPAGALYEAGSYLYSSPGDYGTVDAGLTSAMRSFLGSVSASFPKINGLGSNTWGMVFAVGHSSDPVWHLNGSNVDPRLAPSGAGFHAPANLGQRITGTTDSPMIVDDEASGITVAAQKVAKAPLCTTASCTLNVGPGDYFTHGTNALDVGRAESNCKPAPKHCKASRGRIPDSMLIRADEFTRALSAGTGIGHVLEMFWPETDSSAGFRLPMTGAEGSQVGWGAEGQRVALDPAINLAGRSGCTKEALVVARTLQTNGAYIGDNAGGNSWIIKAEQNSSADPVSAGAFASLSQSELQGCISAGDFVAYTTPR